MRVNEFPLHRGTSHGTFSHNGPERPGCRSSRGPHKGLGKAVAIALGMNGATVVCLARNADKLAATVSEIESAGGVAEAVACDVTDRAAAKAAIEGAKEKHGRLDILVNYAGLRVTN